MRRRAPDQRRSPFIALAALFVALALLATLFFGVIAAPLAILAGFYGGFAALDHVQRSRAPRRGPVAPEEPGRRRAAAPPARSSAR